MSKKQAVIVIGVLLLALIIVLATRQRATPGDPTAGSASVEKGGKSTPQRGEDPPMWLGGRPTNVSQTPSAGNPEIRKEDPSTTPTLVIAEGDTSAAQALLMLNDRPTTSIMGKEYRINPDGSLSELDSRLVPNVRDRLAAQELAEGEGTAEEGVGDTPDENDAGEGELTIAGRVLRGAVGVPDASLILAPSSGSGRLLRTGSTSDGLYAFQGLAAGTYRVMLEKPTAPNRLRTVALQEGESRSNEDFIIPDYPPIRGRVVSQGGEGIGGANIDGWQAQTLRGSIATDEDGSFVLFPLEPGAYRLAVTATGYLPGEFVATVPETGQPEQQQLVLEPTNTIEGVVSGPSGPVERAWVGLFSSGAFSDPLARFGTVNSNANGSFKFSIPTEELPDGFRVGAFREGYVPAYSAPLSPTQPLGSISVVFPAGSFFTGVIQTVEDEPIEGVEVTIKEGFQTTSAIVQRFNGKLPTALSNEQGRFRMTGVETGPTTLVFASEGYVSQEKKLTPVAGENDLGVITMEASDGAAEGRIFGAVVDERGSPLVSHNVYLRHADGRGFSTNTDSRGGFRVDNLPEGGYTLFTNGTMLRGDLFVTMDQTVPNVTPGGPQLYVLYDFGQTARLRVVDEAGQPHRSFRVRAKVTRTGSMGPQGYPEQRGMDWEQTVQALDGSATLSTLLSGTAAFTVTVENVGVKELDARQLGTGANLNLGDVVVAGGGVLEGTVTSATTGSGIGGILVRISRTPGSGAAPISLSTSTASNGSWRLAGVPAGEVNAEFSGTGYVTGSLSGLKANESGPASIALSPAASLGGRVTDPAGQPLNNVELTLAGVRFYSNGEGRFFSDQLAPGTGVVELRDPSGRFVHDPVSVSLVVGQTAQLNLTMDANE